jgi:hypothetical protein
MTVISIASQRARRALRGDAGSIAHRSPWSSSIVSDRSPARSPERSPGYGMSFQQLAAHLESCGQFAQVLVQGLGRWAQRSLKFRSPIGALCSLQDALYLDHDVWRLTIEVGCAASCGSMGALAAADGAGWSGGTALEPGLPVLLSIVFKPIGAQQFVVSLAGMGERFIVRLGQPEDFQRFYEMAFQRFRLPPVAGVRGYLAAPALPGWQVIEATGGT